VSVTTVVPLSEYLNTSYRPDCDYLEGELLGRNAGELDHSRIQMLLGGYLLNREEQLGIIVLPEQRVQVKARRFRVPDITVVAGPMPASQKRISDYLSFGVRYVWLINPRNRQAFVYTLNSVEEAKDGVLKTKDPDIRLSLDELA
jgi:Uma2 family endonuclease